jgi:hypothetical protein
MFKELKETIIKGRYYGNAWSSRKYE